MIIAKGILVILAVSGCWTNDDDIVGDPANCPCSGDTLTCTGGLVGDFNSFGEQVASKCDAIYDLRKALDDCQAENGNDALLACQKSNVKLKRRIRRLKRKLRK